MDAKIENEMNKDNENEESEAAEEDEIPSVKRAKTLSIEQANAALDMES